MPYAPAKPCKHPGCPATSDTGYCEDHSGDRWQDSRQTACQRGYDRRWRKVRLQHLRANPLCHDCLIEGKVTSGSDVHHIAKLTSAPERRLDRTNLMSLCRPHHDKRTANGE